MQSYLLVISSLGDDLLLRVLASNNAAVHMAAHHESAPDELVESLLDHIPFQRLSPEYRVQLFDRRNWPILVMPHAIAYRVMASANRAVRLSQVPNA